MIHMKLDWFSCVVKNISVSEVACRLGLDFPEIVQRVENEIANHKRSEFFIENARGGLVFRCFDYNNVSFRLRNADWMFFVKSGMNVDSIDIFNTVCDEVLLEITGSGLDYLRSINATIDDMLMTEDLFGYQDNDNEVYKAHITRCDIAYDFVNCHEFDFDSMYRELGLLQFARVELIPSVGSNAACKYTLKIGGDERSIYLGTPRSKRLLRIYDKKLERTRKDKKTDFDNLYFTEAEKKKNPSFKLESWFRIEYQLRVEYAAAALYGCGGDLERVMREICSRYKLAYPKGLPDHLHMSPIECFSNVFNYEGLTSVGLNNHFCIIDLPNIQKGIDSWEDRNFVMMCMSFISRRAVPPPWVNNKIIEIYRSDSHTDHCKYQRFKRKLCDFMMFNGYTNIEETGVLYYNADGIIQFRSDRVLTEEESSQLLTHYEQEALKHRNQLLQLRLAAMCDVFDGYSYSIGGLHNDLQMQGVIRDVTEKYGFNPLLEGVLECGDL